MDDFNPYEELGLSKTATQQDIRSAYKKLALRFHPDKPAGDEPKFKRVYEAYQILNDPFKKKVYDAKYNNTKDDEVDSKILEQFLSNMVAVLHEKLKEKLNSRINTYDSTSTSRKTEQGIDINIDVDLKDVYFGEVKKVMIKVHSGEEGDAISKIKPFYISLNNYQDKYVFTGAGDYGSDVNIRLNIVSKKMSHIKHDTIVSKYNVYIETELSLYEYYYGCEKVIPFFEDDIHLKLEPFANSPNNLIHIIKNKGLPYIDEEEEQQRGDVYIHFELVFPTITDVNLKTHEEVLKTLFHFKNE
jgi:DnaJ-class molecular chaperone